VRPEGLGKFKNSPHRESNPRPYQTHMHYFNTFKDCHIKMKFALQDSHINNSYCTYNTNTYARQAIKVQKEGKKMHHYVGYNNLHLGFNLR
jgi:hypothetical protein